jgi:ribosome maturation factor RimP
MRDAAIEAVVSPVLESFGLELDALEVVPAGKRRVVRIVVDGDGPKGRGPLLDDIASASRAVSEALDTSDATGQAAYTLEVSSRGVGRPLTAPKHWRRSTTRLVRVDLLDGSQLTGRITEAGEDAVELDVDGAARELRYDEITKALVQVELNRKVSDAADEAAGSGTEDEIDDEDEDEDDS